MSSSDAANYNQTPYKGASLCATHGWCGHSTASCSGIKRRVRDRKKTGFNCRGDHYIRDCPTRPARALTCHNCGASGYAWEDCPSQLDADKLFAAQKARKEKAQANKVDPEIKAVSLLCIHLAPAAVQDYLTLQEALPTGHFVRVLL